MKSITITSRYFDEKDGKRFKKWLIDNDMTIGVVADKLGVSYVYLYCIINGQRAVTKKLEEKLLKLGFNIYK